MIAPYPVYPLHAGGKIRIVKMARSLADLGVDVTVLAPFHFAQKRTRPACDRFRLVTVKYPFAHPFLLTDRPFPYGFLVSFHPGYRAMIPGKIDGFDVVQVHHPAFVGLANTVAGEHTPIVYDAQNVEADYSCSECRSPLVQAITARRLGRLEKALIRSSSPVFACSEADRDRLHELYDADTDSISLIPNGIDGTGWPAVDTPEDDLLSRFPSLSRFPRRAVFSGSDVEHNRVAVEFIINHLAPTLAAECAFVILGRSGTRFRGAHLNNVFFDNSMDQPAGWDGSETVAINPVTQGSGTSMKTLSYLANRLPLISTPFGMRGLDDLQRFAKIAPLEEFAHNLRSRLPPQPDAATALERYQWQRLATRALAVYTGLRQTSGESRQ